MATPAFTGRCCNRFSRFLDLWLESRDQLKVCPAWTADQAMQWWKALYINFELEEALCLALCSAEGPQVLTGIVPSWRR